MARLRKTQLWLEVSTSLIEYTQYVNKASLERAVSMLEDTGLNVDDKRVLAGLRDGKIPLNGYFDDHTGTGIIPTLDALQGTSVAHRIQFYTKPYYWYGSGSMEGMHLSADGHALVTWSATFNFDGPVNRTSVLQS